MVHQMTLKSKTIAYIKKCIIMNTRLTIQPCTIRYNTKQKIKLLFFVANLLPV